VTKPHAFHARLFHALAHPTRIAIVEALRQGPVSASALLGLVPGDAAHVSTHLTVLREQRLVRISRDAVEPRYVLTHRVLLELIALTEKALAEGVGQDAALSADRGDDR